ncbi:MAG: Smr/MutS family protein [Bacteroidia bacterium]|nr:Smr/MutS family protein [Bacteroidia bacterium]
MEEALAQQEVRRLVAIHGVGNGRLRGEVVRILQRKYPMCSYQDASFKEYGYGATMVLLRRKH